MPIEDLTIEPRESQASPLESSRGSRVGGLWNKVKDYARSSSQEQQEQNAFLTKVGAVVNFSTPQPFSDRLMVLAGVSSDPTESIEKRIGLFSFQINPSRLQRTKRKNQSVIFLGKQFSSSRFGRFMSPNEFHFLNLHLETFAYSGVTPAFNPLRAAGYGSSTAIRSIPGAVDPMFGDYAESKGWYWFLAFQDFYQDYGDHFILMKYMNNFYLGVIDNFSWTRNADAPFNMSYSFQFQSVYAFDVSIVMNYTEKGWFPGTGSQTQEGDVDIVQQVVVRPRTAASEIIGKPWTDQKDAPIPFKVLYKSYADSIIPNLLSDPEIIPGK